MRLHRKLTNEEWKEIGEKYKDGGVYNYRGKRTLFYNGERLADAILADAITGRYLIYDREERQTWQVIIILPGVKVIPEDTFNYCGKVETVIMSDSVKRIERTAFGDCDSLLFVRLSKHLEYIGDYAFANCKSLTSIFIPKSCKKICFWAFDGCKKLIILNVQRKTRLELNVLVNTALTRASHYEIEEVNRWIKNRHNDFPLHKICCSEDPTFNQEDYTVEDWMKKDDDCFLTPLHYLVANRNSSTNMIWSVIKQHESIIIGADKSELGESFLFQLITWQSTITDFLSLLISFCPDILQAKNGDGKTILQIFLKLKK